MCAVDPNRERSSLAIAALFLVGLALVRLATLTALPLLDPDEARYAEAARLVSATVDWSAPHVGPAEQLAGAPPLATWATALSVWSLGTNEAGARAASVAFAAATLVLLYGAARRHRSRAESIGVCLVLASSALFFVTAGLSLPDMALAWSTTGAMARLLRVVDAPCSEGARAHGLAFFAWLGVGLLAGGPVALGLCAGACLIHGLLTRDGRATRGLPWLTGSALMLAIAAPWYVGAEARSPGFLRFLLHENVVHLLGANPGAPSDAGPLWPRGTIVAFLAIAALPWSPVLAVGAWTSRERWRARLRSDPATALLVGFAAAPVLLFAASRNVSPWDALPALPALALLAARLDVFAIARPPSLRLRRALRATVALGALAAALLAVALASLGSPQALLGAAALTIGVASYGVARQRPGLQRVSALAFACTLVVPLLDVGGRLASTGWIPGLDSTRDVTRLIGPAEAIANCPVAFPVDLPYSAAFYLDGRVAGPSDVGAGSPTASLTPPCASRFVVIARRDVEEVPIELLERLERWRADARFVVYREKRLQLAQPAATPGPS